MRAESGAGSADGEGGALFDAGVGGIRRAGEDGAHLEEGSAFDVAADVEGEHVEHAGEERGAEHAGFGAERIAESDGRIGLAGEAGGIVGGTEGGGDGLVPAEGEQGAADGGFFFGPGKFDDGAGERGKRIAEAVVAVDAGDFFDEVDFALEVETPAGQRTAWPAGRLPRGRRGRTPRSRAEARRAISQPRPVRIACAVVR